MKHTDFMALAAENWNKLKPEQKAKYEQLAEKDAQRYSKEMEQWKKHGYYTLPDGTRSDKNAKKKESKSRSKSASKQKPKAKKTRKSEKSEGKLDLDDSDE